MKSQQETPPASGEGLLVTPRATDDEIVRVLGLAVVSLSDLIRYLPTSFVYRCATPKGLVFSEPAPRPLVELMVELLDAGEAPVRLEELALCPVMRLSPAGIRVYVYDEREGVTGLAN